MTITDIRKLPLGAELTLRQGRLKNVVYLACANRDGHGRIFVCSNKPELRRDEQRFRVHPRHLFPMEVAQ